MTLHRYGHLICDLDFYSHHIDCYLSIQVQVLCTSTCTHCYDLRYCAPANGRIPHEGPAYETGVLGCRNLCLNALMPQSYRYIVNYLLRCTEYTECPGWGSMDRAGPLTIDFVAVQGTM